MLPLITEKQAKSWNRRGLSKLAHRPRIPFLILRRYGQEIGRLQAARKKAKDGADIARKGGVSTSVLNDLNVGVETQTNS
jgi:hypothetical protein